MVLCFTETATCFLISDFIKGIFLEAVTASSVLKICSESFCISKICTPTNKFLLKCSHCESFWRFLSSKCVLQTCCELINKIHFPRVIRLEDVLKTFWRHLANLLITSWIWFVHLQEDALKVSWRRFGNVLKTSLEDIFKTFSERLENFWPWWTYSP